MRCVNFWQSCVAVLKLTQRRVILPIRTLKILMSGTPMWSVISKPEGL
jgi:hypothetical protein